VPYVLQVTGSRNRMLVKTLRRWWEKWLSWPCAALVLVAGLVGYATHTGWLVVTCWSIVGAMTLVNVGYGVAIVRMLLARRRRRREVQQRYAEWRAAGPQGRGML